MTTIKPLTIDDIQSAMRARGSHWWDHDTMKFFRTRPVGEVWTTADGSAAYFATSDKQFNGSRAYTVRRYDIAGNDIDTIGELCGYRVRTTAIAAARRLAGAAALSESTYFTPSTPADDLQAAFTNDGKFIGIDHINRLIYLARRHHEECERDCNTGDSRRDDIEERITHWVQDYLPGRKVKFSGDPRGCTVRVILKNNASNGFAGEGWCVHQQ